MVILYCKIQNEISKSKQFCMNITPDQLPIKWLFSLQFYCIVRMYHNKLKLYIKYIQQIFLLIVKLSNQYTASQNYFKKHSEVCISITFINSYQSLFFE